MSLVRSESVFPLSRWIADAAQRDRQLGIALAGEGDLFVGEDGEPVAANHLEIARLHHP